MNILQTIEKQSYIVSHNLPNPDYNKIKDLEKQGLIQTLASIQGFDTMNDSYIYVLKNNPRNVHWKDDGTGCYSLMIKDQI